MSFSRIILVGFFALCSSLNFGVLAYSQENFCGQVISMEPKGTSSRYGFKIKNLNTGETRDYFLPADQNVVYQIKLNVVLAVFTSNNILCVEVRKNVAGNDELFLSPFVRNHTESEL